MQFALADLTKILNIALAVSAATLIAALVLYAIGAKSARRVHIEPTYRLPDGMGAAEAGLILYGSIADRDITALCLQLILDGNMKIVVGDNPDDAILLQGKKPNADSPRYVALFWLQLFRGRSAIAVADIAALCPDIVKLTKKRIHLKYEGVLHIRAYSMSRDAVTMAGALLFGVVTAYAVYAWRARITMSALWGFCAFLMIYVPELNIIKSLGSIKNGGRLRWLKLVIWCAVYAAAVAAISWWSGEFDISTAYMMKLTAVSVILTAAAALIKRPSERGSELSAHLLGLKAFMQSSQRNFRDTRRLFRREPEYFFKALPFSYALGVQDEWLPNIKYNGELKSQNILSEDTRLTFEQTFNRVIDALNSL